MCDPAGPSKDFIAEYYTAARDAETKDYIYQQTMIRVKVLSQ